MFHVEDLLKVVNNCFYSFSISYFVLELFRFVWYVNEINYDVKLCTDHCRLLENHVYLYLKVFATCARWNCMKYLVQCKQFSESTIAKNYVSDQVGSDISSAFYISWKGFVLNTNNEKKTRKAWGDDPDACHCNQINFHYAEHFQQSALHSK